MGSRDRLHISCGQRNAPTFEDADDADEHFVLEYVFEYAIIVKEDWVSFGGGGRTY